VFLVDLASQLAAAKKTDRYELQWLAGATDAKYVPELFECLILARRFEEDPFGASGVLESALAAVGGERVVAGYDEIISSRPFSGAQFMRLQRERVVQVELQRAGNEIAHELAGAVGVALLRSRED
jgi:hypothetical protein